MNKEVIIDIENPKDNDLISRQAFITRYDEWMYSEYGHHASEDAFGLRVVKSLPPVKPYDADKFCLNCGCHMIEPQESE